MDYGIDRTFANDLSYFACIADITLHETVPGMFCYIGKAFEIARIRKFIVAHHCHVRAVPQQETDKIASDKPSTTSDEHVLHSINTLLRMRCNAVEIPDPFHGVSPITCILEEMNNAGFGVEKHITPTHIKATLPHGSSPRE